MFILAPQYPNQFDDAMNSKILTSIFCIALISGLPQRLKAQTANDIVFDIAALDGSAAQQSITDNTTLFYATQPFTVTSELVNGDAIEYNTLFNTEFAELFQGDDTGLDVRTWDSMILYMSTAADALNGTPTASFEFNLLEAQAVNGMQFQDLIVQETGPTGSTHYNFIPVADLGSSSINQPFHQLTQTFPMDTELTLQNNSTTTLASFLSQYEGQTLHLTSLLDGSAAGGFYSIAGDESLGSDSIIHFIDEGFNVDVGFAHSIEPVTNNQTPELGDVNLDGDVNFLDISPFIGVLSSQGFQAEADCDENGVVNFLDISPFIQILSGQQ